MVEHASDHLSHGLKASAVVLVNVVTAYESVRFRLTDVALHVDWPVMVLGVVPRRRVRSEFPLTALRSIRLTPAVFPSRLLVAGLLLVGPIPLGLPAAVVLLAGVLAVLFLLLSIVATVEIATDEGTTRIPVCALQRRGVASFLAEVRAAVPGGDR